MHAIVNHLYIFLASFACVISALRLQTSLDHLYHLLRSPDFTASADDSLKKLSSLLFLREVSVVDSIKVRAGVYSTILFNARLARNPSGGVLVSATRAPIEENVDRDIYPGAGAKRQTAIAFWKYDMSGGAGSISSPNFTEHFKDASEAAMFYERFAAGLLEGSPAWLLFSTLAAVTREIASRRVQLGIVPGQITDPSAQKKAQLLAKNLRENFDARIQNALKPGAFSTGGNFIRRIVNAESELAFSDIGSVISTEVFQAFSEVIEAETTGRVQLAIGDAIQLNQSSAEKDLADLMTRADGDGNEVITLDEIYELVVGSPIGSSIAPIARKWPVLKSVSTVSNSWEWFTSLLIAPHIRSLSEGSNVARSWFERNGRHFEDVVADVERLTHDGYAGTVENLRTAFPAYVHLFPVAPSKAQMKVPFEINLDDTKGNDKENGTLLALGTVSRRQKFLKLLRRCFPWKWRRRNAS